jgi:hypothetical protein
MISTRLRYGLSLLGVLLVLTFPFWTSAKPTLEMEIDRFSLDHLPAAKIKGSF